MVAAITSLLVHHRRGGGCNTGNGWFEGGNDVAESVGCMMADKECDECDSERTTQDTSNHRRLHFSLFSGLFQIIFVFWILPVTTAESLLSFVQYSRDEERICRLMPM